MNSVAEALHFLAFMKFKEVVAFLSLGFAFGFLSSKARAAVPVASESTLHLWLTTLPVIEAPEKKSIVDLGEIKGRLKEFEPIMKIVKHIDELQVGNGQYKFVYKTEL